MLQQTFFMNYGQTLSTVDSADFDGTNDYMARGAGWTGAADSKSGILSAWIRLDGGNAAILGVLTGPNAGVTSYQFTLIRRADNTFAIAGKNAAGTERLLMISTTTYTAAATWIHILASWNLATTTGNLYIADTNVLDTGTDVLVDDTLDYTLAEWYIGAYYSAGNRMDGCLAEVYFAPGQYLDFSIVANRRRFISANGKPVWLGSDGSIPTGTAPIVYQRVADGAAVATFATNLGTGGNLSITGTLDLGSSSPSD